MAAEKGAEGSSKAGAPAVTRPAPRRSGKAKWIALLVVATAGFVAVKVGLFSFAWAQVKARAFPRDAALLEWVPKGTRAIAILDPHQLGQQALGEEQGAARRWLARTRDDVEKATGIDLLFDVHKVVASDGLVVARGRFDGEELAERLAQHKYAPSEHAGRTILVRAGEDAIAVVDGDVLLYGSESGVRAAIDAESSGEGLDDDEKVMARLGRVGWNNALLGTAQINDEQPSLRALISGGTGPRSITIGMRAQQGVTTHVEIEAATPAAADELAKLLDQKRAAAGNAPGELGPVLADIAKNAKIETDAKLGTVNVRASIPPAALEALANAASKNAGSLSQAYDTMRLIQLLAP